MPKNSVAIIIVVIVLIALGWWVISNNQKKSTEDLSQQSSSISSEPSQSSSNQEASGATEEQNKNVITIDSSGFSTKELKIKAGEGVTWKNTDSKDHQVNSVVHPTHQVYPPLNTIGLLKPGQSRSLTFPDKGTFKYHDHLNPQFFGSIVVE
ncbi:cupredoxin domain-containing protein [Candidatus Daviesbacteria bacterium]|nr:cupredoxin domain-containing protein [Candidatus Daviesbacteria bacterium]